MEISRKQEELQLKPMYLKHKMAKVKINPENWSGRTQDILDVFGEKVLVGSEFVEIADEDVKVLCLNPNLYIVE